VKKNDHNRALFGGGGGKDVMFGKGDRESKYFWVTEEKAAHCRK
jgi:hypothetical protein